MNYKIVTNMLLREHVLLKVLSMNNLLMSKKPCEWHKQMCMPKFIYTHFDLLSTSLLKKQCYLMPGLEVN